MARAGVESAPGRSEKYQLSCALCEFCGKRVGRFMPNPRKNRRRQIGLAISKGGNQGSKTFAVGLGPARMDLSKHDRRRIAQTENAGGYRSQSWFGITANKQ